MEPTPLALRIAGEIGEGRISFARFMERALYDPQDGYYMRRVPPEVRDRDYYTSPDVSEAFGRCLARQFAEMWSILDGPPEFRIVELGAGRGLLCRDILQALEQDAPECLSSATYLAVETSPARRKKIQEGVDSAPGEKAPSWRGRITWTESLDEVPPGVTGVVFSNELFDAFPVHRLCPTADDLLEVYVRAKEGQFTEELGAPSTPALAAYFDALGLSFAEGDNRGRAEVNLAAVELIEKIGRKLERGFVLTLDYGYPASALYAPHRVAGGGTLMCYHRHRAHADPYIHVGEQDMTAHVDFSALTLAGRKAGLEPVGFTDQNHLLMGLGIARDVRPVPARQEGEGAIKALYRNLAIKNLLLPGGLGGTLKVLVQRKGIAEEKAQSLSALKSALFKVSDLSPGGVQGAVSHR